MLSPRPLTPCSQATWLCGIEGRNQEDIHNNTVFGDFLKRKSAGIISEISAHDILTTVINKT